jgi:carbonic anhydrase/acetyltransferase-like protein (isoleucine patch superfamily)
MSEKKYKLIKEDFGELYRIRAIRDFGKVKAGEIGGCIEKEENLSHDGKCWVGVNAKVYGDSRVEDDARVFENAKVYGNVLIKGNARVYGNSILQGDVKIYDNALVHGETMIQNNTIIEDNAIVYNALIFGYNNMIKGNAIVCNNAWIPGNALIASRNDIKVISNIGSNNKPIIFFRDNTNSIIVSYNSFIGNFDEFSNKYKEDKDNFKEILAAINFALATMN